MITTRLATSADAEAIARINVETWIDTYSGLIDEAFLETLSIEKRTADWQRICSQIAEYNPTIVAIDEHNTILGYCGGGKSRVDGYDGEIYALYVHPRFHRMGVGRILMQEFFKRTQHCQWQTVCVRVLAGNPARGFYENMGATFVRPESITFGGKQYTDYLLAWEISEVN
jgi:ribosomal protein S18 acetylase RimI-like enzyme